MRFLSLVVALLALPNPTSFQEPVSQPSDGAVLAQTQCEFVPYEQASPFTRRHYSQQEYDATSRNTDIDCTRIRYTSDGLGVVGFIVRPRSTNGARYPVVIYNRGGFRDIGKIDAWNLVDFYGFASQGFVVLASQYRGNDGGEGRDEVGGSDVGDVMALSRLAERLPYADSSNMFLYGLSRGGMMSFLVLARGFPAKAVAVVGAVFDIEAFQKRAPTVVASAVGLDASHDVALLRERSVMNWPDRINIPLLIIHGSRDEEVPATEALTFATKLAQLGKRYQLIVYADDVHEAANNRRDRDTRIAAWFKQHMGR